jgi:hypothetical protein
MTIFGSRLACLTTLVVCVACGEKEHAPLLKTVGGGNEDDESGLGGAGSSETGGRGSGGSNSETGGSHQGGSGAVGASERPDHPMYFVAGSDDGPNHTLCDLFSGEAIVTDVVQALPNAFADPIRVTSCTSTARWGWYAMPKSGRASD